MLQQRKKTQEQLDRRLRSALAEWVKMGRHREQYDSLEDIAADLNCSKEQLTYYFAHSVGMKFYTWRKHIRIEDAKNLLLTRKDLSVTRIGTIVGIPDKSDFRRQFYEITGCYPYDWRTSGNKKEYKKQKLF